MDRNRSRTWRGATTLTGSYDASLRLSYWTEGNPCPAYDRDERRGDNLHTNSVAALDVKTGVRKLCFQFTLTMCTAGMHSDSGVKIAVGVPFAIEGHRLVDRKRQTKPC